MFLLAAFASLSFVLAPSPALPFLAFSFFAFSFLAFNFSGGPGFSPAVNRQHGSGL
jgi:hypothetical protein